MKLKDRWYLFTFPLQGGGCGLMTRTRKFEEIIKGMNCVSLAVASTYKAFYPFFFTERNHIVFVVVTVGMGGCNKC